MLIAQNRGCCPPSVRQELTCIAVHSPQCLTGHRRHYYYYRCCCKHSQLLVVARLSSSALVSINVVTLRRARLLLGSVTVCGRVNHLGM